MIASRTSLGGALIAALALASVLTAQNAPPAPPGTRAGAPAQAGGRGGSPITSPQIGADRRVTFRLRAPAATDVLVAVAGKRLPMQKDDQGVWSVTTDALAPDIYTYSFVLDGTTITDPSNREFQTSAGSVQNMFAVPGPGAWLPRPDVPRGAVARHVFHSAVANDDREFFVYMPPGYEARRAQPYPVFYLLHGLGDDAGRWVNAGGANNILDNLVAERKALPMVMVTTLGYGTADGPNGARGPRAQENLTGYTTSLLDEVMPAVERSYNVSRDRNQRAIAGLSMGGIEALLTGLNHLDKFAWIGSFSGALTMYPNPAAPRPPRRHRRLRPPLQVRPPPRRPVAADAAGRRRSRPWTSPCFRRCSPRSTRRPIHRFGCSGSSAARPTA